MTLEKTLIITINTALPGYHPGEEIKIPVDQHGTPKDKYWRKRLRDSKIDKCIEIKEAPKKENGTSRKKTKSS